MPEQTPLAPTSPPRATDPLNYWDYLKLNHLLDLQGGHEPDDRALVPDELLFIIVHQCYELWFKQVIRELREAIRSLGDSTVPEAEVPNVVHHLRRVVAILRLAVEQFSVMETLTPQDFLGFRDKLVPASGFQSFQMREMEILLGLEEGAREAYGQTAVLDHIRELGQSSAAGRYAWARVDAAVAEAASGGTLRQALASWLYRTPIQGSQPTDPGDNEAVIGFISDYLQALEAHHSTQIEALLRARVSPEADVRRRFAMSLEGARRFLLAQDRPEAEQAATRRARAGLLYVESYRSFPLLAWPRLLVDTVVELEEQLVLWRQRHARMVERVIGRRVGTGGSSGVEYLDRTTQSRVFTDLWNVRTLLLPKDHLPPARNVAYYGFVAP